MGQVAQMARSLAGQPGFDPRRRMGGDFSSFLPVKTGPEVHLASYKVSTRGKGTQV